MTQNKWILSFLLLSTFSYISCDKVITQPNASAAKVNFVFHFDETQDRLDNFGNPAELAVGHAAQTPEFRKMGAHFLGLYPDKWTPYSQGVELYKGEETDKGGTSAVDFQKLQLTGDGETFLESNISDIPVGTYEWLRISVAFQDYQVNYNLNEIPFIGNLTNEKATVASFLGFNNYIEDYQINNLLLDVNGNRNQGFWAFETDFQDELSTYNDVFSGQSPEGATTVVNPLFNSSPIPAGSCVITGKFDPPLVITGEETENIDVTLSFSINNSFEWEDLNGNGTLDFNVSNPSENEKVVDMGVRGLKVNW